MKKNSFFGELLENILNEQEAREDRRNPGGRNSAAQSNEPGFFGRLGNYLGGEASRAKQATANAASGVGRSVDRAAQRVGQTLPYKNPVTDALVNAGIRWSGIGAKSADLDSRIAQQNQMNQRKYEASPQSRQDTKKIYADRIQQANQELQQMQQRAPVAAPPAVQAARTATPPAQTPQQTAQSIPRFPQAPSGQSNFNYTNPNQTQQYERRSTSHPYQRPGVVPYQKHDPF